MIDRVNDKQRLIKTYSETYNSLLQVAISIVCSREAAYDVLQNLAVKILEIDSKTEIRYPKAYLRRAVRHAAVDYVRTESRYVLTDPNYIEQTADTVAASVDRFEADDLLRKHLQGLSPEVREAFLRYCFDGEPIEQIAKEMHLNAATLRQQLRRIRRRIPKETLLLTLLYSILY